MTAAERPGFVRVSVQGAREVEGLAGLRDDGDPAEPVERRRERDGMARARQERPDGVTGRVHRDTHLAHLPRVVVDDRHEQLAALDRELESSGAEQQIAAVPVTVDVGDRALAAQVLEAACEPHARAVDAVELQDEAACVAVELVAQVVDEASSEVDDTGELSTSRIDVS